ncbi:hypothetical protein BJ912DRAFT_566046 [Pholiota molesta]|nr:hypothetical protein BJ912DRAFT_566046 [Pholiota molesta]
MKKPDPIPPGPLSVTRKPFQFVALDTSRYQTPADDPVLDPSPSLASAGSAPTEPQPGASSTEAKPLLKAKEKPLRWVQVDPTEVHGSLRFRILPVFTPETPDPSAPKPKCKRSAPRKVTSRARPVAHEDSPTTIKTEETPTLQQRAPSSGKAKGKRRSALDPQRRLISARRSPSRDRDSDTSSRCSVETDSVSSATDCASLLRDSEPPPRVRVLVLKRKRRNLYRGDERSLIWS